MIKFVEAGDCLVEKIVDELLLSEDVSGVNVILPTRRLANYVCLRLSQKKTATWFPSFYSIEEFVDKYAKTKSTIIDEMSSELVLGGILLNGTWKYLKPGLESELLVFFNSAIESEKDVFSEIEEVLRQDVYRSVKGAERLLAMNEEIDDCLKEFEKTLSDAGMMLAVRQLKNTVKDFQNVEIREKDIIVAGFTTMRPVLLPALKKLATVSRMIFNEPFEMISSVSPLLDMITSIGGTVTVKVPEIRSQIDLFECSDITAEIELMVSWLKELFQSAVSPSSIAILIADEERYGPLVQSALKRENIEANVSLPLSLGRTPLGELFKSVADLNPHEASILQIAMLSMHPLLSSPQGEQFIEKLEDLKARNQIANQKVKKKQSDVIQGDGNQTEKSQKPAKSQKARLIEEITVTAKGELDERHRISAYLAGEIDFHVRPKYALCHHFWENKLEELCKTFGLHLSPQPLSQWLEFMTDLLKQLKPEELEQERDKRASLIEASKSILNSILKASRMISMDFSPGEFWNLISNKVLLSEIRTVGYPLKGVQVLSVKEARHVPFDYIFIPGMLEGTFPAKLPRDTLIEDWLKRKAKIPSWSYIEAMEDTTFGLMLQRIPSITLSWPRELEGRESVRSRFVERLKALKKPFHHYRSGAFKLFGQAETSSAAVVMSAKNELKNAPIRPSSIETLLACPWQYYLISNQVRFWQLLESEEDFLSDGNWVHEVVESFLNLKSENINFAESETESQITDCLINLAEEKRKSYDVSQSFYLHMKLKGWPELAKDFKLLFKGWKGGERELFIGRDFLEKDLNQKKSKFFDRSVNNAKIKVGEATLHVLGRIDAIEEFEWGRVIIDFKRSTIPPVSDVTKGIKPQLTLYAAVLGFENTALAYWGLKASDPKVVSSSTSPDGAWGSPRARIKTPQEAFENFKVHLEWRLSEPQVYPDIGDICTRCNFNSSCRKNDPRLQSTLESMAQWESRIK